MKRLAWTLAGVLLASVAAQAGGAAPSAREIRPLMIGASVPAVTVRTVAGAAVDLTELTAERRAVLVFYRGGW